MFLLQAETNINKKFQDYNEISFENIIKIKESNHNVKQSPHIPNKEIDQNNQKFSYLLH